jgi:Raf kinase inhibitor-like YbhB/YbcL family protein
MRIRSSAFGQDERIPTRYTCEGEDISPEISWEEAPEKTAAFALILHDPDAPRTDGFTHWMVYNIPRNVTHIPEKLPEGPRVSGVGLQGKNDGGKVGYLGPCPPSGTHRYYLRLFALRQELDLGPAATATEVQLAMHDHIIEQAELMGTYAKTRAKSA